MASVKIACPGCMNFNYIVEACAVLYFRLTFNNAKFHYERMPDNPVITGFLNLP